MGKILLTGGAGYIGSHVALRLMEEGCEIVIADNLSNSDKSVLGRIEKISGKKPLFYKTDMLNVKGLEKIFSSHSFDAIIHLAGKKAVGESVSLPLDYYQNNVTGTLNLLECCKRHKVYNFVFSSSATVYGASKEMPVDENSPLGCTNPYGWTKLTIERILQDLYASDNNFNIALLRYFNPVGAHESGLIGESPNDIPNNLTPYVLKVASGLLPDVKVFGNDYDTPDGTGVRDYIHIADLAAGHAAALNKLKTKCGLVVYNLGRGKGHSVLEVISAFEKACGHKIPYVFAPRRAGDVATVYADCKKAKKELNWTAELTLGDMARDAWRWQQYFVKNILPKQNKGGK